MPQPAICNKGRQVREYPIAAGQTFVEGAAVLHVDGEIEECGADPAAILGFALHDAGVDPDPSIVLVALAGPESTFFLAGSSAPLATDVGVDYGIAKHADGEWIVDKTDVLEPRLHVESVDLTRGLFEVRVLGANRQLEV